MLRVSERITNIANSPIRKLTPLADAAKAVEHRDDARAERDADGGKVGIGGEAGGEQAGREGVAAQTDVRCGDEGGL